MPALVRSLVEWLPTSADWAGYVAGPLVVLGYLAGSVLPDRVPSSACLLYTSDAADE